MSPAQHAASHHHRTPELPRHWISLPAAVRRAAQHDRLLRGLFPSHVGFFPRAGQHRVQRDAIESTIFNYCVRGAGWGELSGRRFSVLPGDVLVLPSGLPHAYGTDTSRPWSVYWFHAMGENLPALLAELRLSVERPVVHVGHQRELVALFSELRQTLEDDYARPQLLYATQLLGYLIGVLIRRSRDASPAAGDTARRVHGTVEHLRRHFVQAIRVETLAEMAGMSASQYSVRFRQLTGRSPRQYLTRLRLQRAAQLLDTSADSVASIARRVGYEDALYFSRAFRRLHDMSPTEYRQGRR